MKKFKFNLQLFADEVVAEPVSAQDAPQPVETPTPVQADIDSMKAAIAQFGTAGAKYFPDELAAMQQKLADMEVKAAAKAETIKEEIQQEAGKLMTIEQSFAQKYGNAIGHVLEIGLLAYIAGHLVGVI
jgi:molecular chaperone DnaK (HSP70)